MDKNLNSFGLRLRSHIEAKGTLEEAYRDIGVSRATLFNWLDRDTPPERQSMLERLRRYLGAEADFILDGRVSKLDSNEESNFSSSFRDEAARILHRVIEAAEKDPVREAWIVEQLRQHLRVPAHWRSAATASEPGNIATDDEIDRQIRAENRKHVLGQESEGSGMKSA